MAESRRRLAETVAEIIEDNCTELNSRNGLLPLRLPSLLPYALVLLVSLVRQLVRQLVRLLRVLNFWRRLSKRVRGFGNSYICNLLATPLFPSTIAVSLVVNATTRTAHLLFIITIFDLFKSVCLLLQL